MFVAHPGAPDELFSIERTAERGAKPCILFVGGDFERKGGAALLEAFAGLGGAAELAIVTEADIPAPAGVRIERGVRPGTARFGEIFGRADIFCLPTLGDCTPVALGEALAAGLPVVTTAVGSNASTVRDGVTGMLIEPGNVAALESALRMLVEDPAARRSMGEAARADARERFSARTNATRIFDMIEGLL
jgi:glycosyltransferase involved in cell wall biosynthesis